MTRKLVEVHELNGQREKQQAFEQGLFRSTELTTRVLNNGDEVHELVATVDSIKGKQKITATIIASRNIQSLPVAEQQRLVRHYENEFVRPGSPMKHPDEGHVVLFSINDVPTGFFYLGENEKVENGLIPSVFKHIEAGLLQFKDFPTELKNILSLYYREVGTSVHLRQVGSEVARPMRFYIYPEAQGNGGLKVLLALTKLATAVLNPDTDEMYMIIEARAGLIFGTEGSQSTFAGHQLVPAYLAKGMDLTVYGPRRGKAKGTKVFWKNDPYYNFSLAYFVPVAEILSLITID